MMNRILLQIIIYVFIVNPVLSWAGSYDDIERQYPTDAFLIGIAESPPSKDAYTDIRRVEMLAQVEIARQLKVRVMERSIDVMCEGEGKMKMLFSSNGECRNQIVVIVESTVDETLVGSRIVEKGKDKASGLFYAVAVLPKKNVLSIAKDGFNEAIVQAEDTIKKAKESIGETEKKGYIQKAKQELLKAGVYEEEMVTVEDVRIRAEDMFKRIADEIKKVEKEL